MGLTPHFLGGVVGLSPFFKGLGFFLNFVSFGWWWFYFDFLGGFLNFFFFFFFLVLGLKFINICSTFAHSFTQFFSCTVGKCKCWTVCFCCFWAIKQQFYNCFWKIRVALKRAGFGVTCAG